MAKPKAGYILRSDIRRVACPECGALPGAFCTSFDKREHAGRTTAALAKDAPTIAGAEEVKTAPSMPVAVNPSSPDVEQPEVTTPVPSPALAALKEFDNAVARTLAPLCNQILIPLAPALVGQPVQFIVTHGPTNFFDQEGTLVSLDVVNRCAQLRSDLATAVVQWGENDLVQILGDPR